MSVRLWGFLGLVGFNAVVGFIALCAWQMIISTDQRAAGHDLDQTSAGGMNSGVNTVSVK